MKVLCFHGFNQNSELMRKKCKLLIKRFKWVQFDFIDAPNKIQEMNYWWCNDKENPLNMRWENPSKHGITESIDYVREIVAQNGPYDCLLGFSQGAAFINILLQEKIIETQSVILFSGFTPMIRSIANVCSLHVYGEADTTIPPELSEQCAQCYMSPVIVKHKGTHVICTTSAVLTPMRTLLPRNSHLNSMPSLTNGS